MTDHIRTVELCKDYGAGDSLLRVLQSVSLNVQSGERLAILGRSGSGKSTLLHLLAGLDIPTSGSILINDHPIESLNSSERAHYRLHRVGMIFQAFHLVANRTALENVELPAMIAGIDRRERLKRAEAALEAVGLAGRLHHRPMELSGGERQRVAIARALSLQPPLLLADEPTGNLDSSTAKQVMQLLMEQVQRNRATFVLVTHDETFAHQIADRVLHMQDGRLVGELS